MYKNEKDITEIHVLNGENNFKSFLFEYKTWLHNLIIILNLKLGIIKKIYLIYIVIKKWYRNKFYWNSYFKWRKAIWINLTNLGTALYETDDNSTFGIEEYNNNEKYNIYCIQNIQTNSKRN